MKAVKERQIQQQSQRMYIGLPMLEDEDDRTSYTMSGTAEINPKSFTMGDLVFRLKDEQKKQFEEEHAFQVCKTPTPGVSWDYVETWEYVEDQYNTTFLITVNYITRKSPTDFNFIPVSDIDKLDGSIIWPLCCLRLEVLQPGHFRRNKI